MRGNDDLRVISGVAAHGTGSVALIIEDKLAFRGGRRIIHEPDPALQRVRLRIGTPVGINDQLLAAAAEAVGRDGRDAGGNGHSGQIGAAGESSAFDAGHGFRNHNADYTRISSEGPRADELYGQPVRTV